jgi:hypothetical protein
MIDLCTLEQVKARIRVDGSDMDADLQDAIQGASAACIAYLKKCPWQETEDVPPNVQNACVMLVGIFIRDPDGADWSAWQMGYLPTPVTALLYPLRDPALS